jgi:hypothetical protein
MAHIRQKLEITGRNLEAYTVVDTSTWAGPLNMHPSIVEHPELFEISNDEIPEIHQFLIYQP